MASQNGIGGAAGYSGMNGNMLPNAGHYSDMQTLMQNMESLSGWLQQNRDEWMQVQEGLARVERLQGRLARDGPMSALLQNGDAQSTQVDADQPTTVQLQNALSHAQQRITSLETTSRDQFKVQQLYEDALTEATDRIRQYCFEQQNHIIALHHHYTTLLSQSRNETMEVRLTHQAWQASLARVSEGMRLALQAREEEGRPWKRRIAALKEENRILRAKVGWDPPVDSEDEGEGEDEEHAGRVDARGRGSQQGRQVGVAAGGGGGGGGGAETVQEQATQ